MQKVPKSLIAFALVSLALVSIAFKDSESHFLGKSAFVRDYYIVFTTIPDFPAPNEPSVLAFTIADAKTLSHIPEADVIIKVSQGENVISTVKERYVGYDAFVAYTFRDEGEYKVIFEISVANDPQLITTQFDVQVKQKQSLVFEPIMTPISGEPSGNIVIQPNHFFEVGVALKKGETLQYSYRADTKVMFNIHSHDGSRTTNYILIEGTKRNVPFTAPNSGNYYLLWQNQESSETRMKYDILFPKMSHAIDYANQTYNINLSTNANIEDITFHQPMKQLLMKVETPFLTPGFINITIPKVLLDGSFDVKGGSAQFIVIETDSDSVLLINTDDGSHDIAIIGTTAIPEIPLTLIIFAFSVFILLTLVKTNLYKKMF